MTTASIAIIGGGNMGKSLIGGLISHGYQPQQLWATDISQEKLAELKQEYGIQTTSDNLDAVKHADVVLFAIKPQLFADVAVPLAAVIQTRKPLVISIAAGIRSDSIEHWLGGNVSVVRCMPNTPALIRQGASGLYASPQVSAEQRKLAESILSAVGIVTWVKDEHLIDSVTALSGSGPAYIFLVIEAMQAAGEKLGLSHQDARQLAIQTVIGAAQMANNSSLSAAELRKQVTSPGGTTEKAISVLENYNIRGIFEEAMKAASLRSEELATILGGKS